MEICHECAIQALNVYASNTGSTSPESEVLRKLLDGETLDAGEYLLIHGSPVTKWKNILNKTELWDVDKLATLIKNLSLQTTQTMNEYEKQCFQKVLQAVLKVVKEKKLQT